MLYLTSLHCCQLMLSIVLNAKKENLVPLTRILR